MPMFTFIFCFPACRVWHIFLTTGNMTHVQFLKLPFNEQCILLKNLAVPVAECRDAIHKYYLFQLDAFYIEIIATVNEDVIEELVSFSDTVLLGKYLDRIDIFSMLK